MTKSDEGCCGCGGCFDVEDFDSKGQFIHVTEEITVGDIVDGEPDLDNALKIRKTRKGVWTDKDGFRVDEETVESA